MEPDVLTMFTQLGAAGLIGLLWIVERRHASKRDGQLDEAHQRIIGQQQHIAALLVVIKENTRAIEGLQKGQQQLIELLRRGGSQRGTDGGH